MQTVVEITFSKYCRHPPLYFIAVRLHGLQVSHIGITGNQFKPRTGRTRYPRLQARSQSTGRPSTHRVIDIHIFLCSVFIRRLTHEQTPINQNGIANSPKRSLFAFPLIHKLLMPRLSPFQIILIHIKRRKFKLRFSVLLFQLDTVFRGYRQIITIH